MERLEDRWLLAIDFGDAPDTGVGTSAGNYNTLLADNGPRHTIVAGLKMGANVDMEPEGLPNSRANGDEVTTDPDDEDGLTNPAAELTLTVGSQPKVNVWGTNTTGSTATLYGWIDYNANGLFDNATELASVAVPTGSNNVIKTLTFPAVPIGFTGETYARFRLSTTAAANPTGAAANGEVKDYTARITLPGLGAAGSFAKIASGTGGGPTLANSDRFGRSVANLGDLDGDGVADLAVGANFDDTGGAARGAVHVLFLKSRVDFGDAPDSSAGTRTGNYQTRTADGGPAHFIDNRILLGTHVDGEAPDAVPTATANGDDTDGALPDDEDGLNNAAADLLLTIGAQPTVNVRVTNTTGLPATLYGWIDYNANGVFENDTERAQTLVPGATSSTVVTLTFPAVPSGVTGKTYARFRFSTDTAAANPTGAASNGEVEDYPATILAVSNGTVQGNVKISDGPGVCPDTCHPTAMN